MREGRGAGQFTQSSYRLQQSGAEGERKGSEEGEGRRGGEPLFTITSKTLCVCLCVYVRACVCEYMCSLHIYTTRTSRRENLYQDNQHLFWTANCLITFG